MRCGKNATEKDPNPCDGKAKLQYDQCAWKAHTANATTDQQSSQSDGKRNRRSWLDLFRSITGATRGQVFRCV